MAACESWSCLVILLLPWQLRIAQKNGVRRALVAGAVQAALIDSDFMEDFGFVWVDLSAEGRPPTLEGQNLLPGYFHPANTDIGVWYDAWCANGLMGDFCVELHIDGRHCSGGTWYMHQSMHNGPDLNLEWQAAPGGC